ncbi:hypothetical protein BBJ28_00019023 [Nothophytophthora sp. Chile5]|nr:hypothetical protein BBJ28_00019023 [Nothophytophthora sp. Chile5]
MDDLLPWTEADEREVGLEEMDSRYSDTHLLCGGVIDSLHVSIDLCCFCKAEERELAPQPQDEEEAVTTNEETDEEEAVTTNEETDEEEAVEDGPIIPGLSGVDLFAFNAEYANGEVLETIIDWSYDQTAAASPYRDNFIHVNDLYEFLLKTLNPLNDDIDEEDHEILVDAVLELRKAQGLVDDDMIVHRGFIARGMPLRFLQSLAHKMHQTVQTRRLQTSDSHREL